MQFSLRALFAKKGKKAKKAGNRSDSPNSSNQSSSSNGEAAPKGQCGAESPSEEALAGIPAVFAILQPIFDASGDLVGRELSAWDGTEALTAENSAPTPGSLATAMDLTKESSPGKKSPMRLVKLGAGADLAAAGKALAPGECVLVVEAQDLAGGQNSQELADLAGSGHKVAFRGLESGVHLGSVISTAKLVKAALGAREVSDLSRITAEAQGAGIPAVAEAVENEDRLGEAKGYGFSLFQGFYYRKPAAVAGKQIKGPDARRLEILKELSSSSWDAKALERLISADGTLSYRLLRYVNSPAFAVREKISSIRTAVALLGGNELTKWYRAVAMSGFAVTDQGREIARTARVRARFFELLSGASPRAPRPPDAMFLLGLFSFLDGLLDRPMVEIVAALSLEPGVAQALCGEDNELSVYLELAGALERGRYRVAAENLKLIGVDPKSAAAMHAQAICWAMSQDAL